MTEKIKKHDDKIEAERVEAERVEAERVEAERLAAIEPDKIEERLAKIEERLAKIETGKIEFVKMKNNKGIIVDVHPDQVEHYKKGNYVKI